MDGLTYYLIPYLLVLLICQFHGVSSNCNFPNDWTKTKWMTERIEPIANPPVYDLITYTPSESYSSLTTTPNTKVETHTCGPSEIINERKYYVNPARNRCVEEYTTNDVLFHRERTDLTNINTATACKNALTNQLEYNVYLPVSLKEGFQIEASTTCPFPNLAYLVTYTFSNLGGTECENTGKTSVASVASNSINILACKHSLFPRLPLTGALECLADVRPTALEEADDSNGKILLLKWTTRNQEEAFIYCVRYKMLNNGDIMLSVDITSNSLLQCVRNAKYDWFGSRNGREFIRMNFIYEPLFASPSANPGTTTTPGGSNTPSSSTSTTTRAPQLPIHIQFALDYSHDSLQNIDQFVEGLLSVIGTATGATPDRISDLIISKSANGNVVVTFTLGDGTPSVNEIKDTFGSIVGTGQFAVQNTDGNDIFVKGDSFYAWRAEDPCPTLICQNGGTCWVLQGDYSCTCIGNFTSPTCENQIMTTNEPTMTVVSTVGSTVTDQSMITATMTVQPIGSGQQNGDNKTNTTIIIVVCCIVGVAVVIAVVVFVVRRQRRDKAKDDSSETGYDNEGISMEEKDRELYSTFNKKPKAYHDRSFTDLTDDRHGEQTGIQG